MATTMKTSERKYTTLEEVENASSSAVWVINTTERVGEAGNLILSVPKLNGNGTDAVRIRKTFIPVNLSEQVPKAQLMGSSEFRNTVRKGLLKLCNPVYAKALLDTEEGKEEKRRVDNLLRASMVALDNANVSGADDEDDEDQFFDPTNMAGAKKSPRQQAIEQEVAAKEVKVAAKVVDIKIQNMVANATNENWTQTKVLTALRNHGKITREDIKFLAASFKNSPKVIARLREVKAKMDAKKAKATA